MFLLNNIDIILTIINYFIYLFKISNENFDRPENSASSTVFSYFHSFSIKILLYKEL